MILDLSRVEKTRLLNAMNAAMLVPDKIESQRLAAFEARAYAFVNLQPYQCLEAYVLADVIEDHLHTTQAARYSIRLSDVEEQALCTTDTAKNALRFLGMFKSPVHGPGVFTNDPTGVAAVLTLPAPLFENWRSLNW
jgi:hypothetical protein